MYLDKNSDLMGVGECLRPHHPGYDAMDGAGECQCHTLPHHRPLAQAEAAGEGGEKPVCHLEQQPRTQHRQWKG